MSEKYYVVSESELQKLAGTFYEYESDDEEQDIEAACRARPFEKYQAVVEAANIMMRRYSEHEDPETNLLNALEALKEDV